MAGVGARRDPAAPGCGHHPQHCRAPGAPQRPTSLDQAEATLTYVRTDLARILILAAVMIGIIVVLAFVLR